MKTKGRVGYCAELNMRNSFKTHQKVTKRTVLKMLAVMENQQPCTAGPSKEPDENDVKTPENGHQAKEFLATGRTGRRNALPDILAQQATVACSDLPNRFNTLTTKDGKVDKCTKDKPGTCHKSS